MTSNIQDELLNQKTTYAKVHDRIFIGSADSIYDEHFLVVNKIKLIINASNTDMFNKLNIDTLKVIDIEDTMPVNIRFNDFAHKYESKAKSVNKQMHTYIRNRQNVLVHCIAGVNRSALIIGTYLRDYCNILPAKCIDMIVYANRTQRNMPALTNNAFRYIIEQNHIVKQPEVNQSPNIVPVKLRPTVI